MTVRKITGKLHHLDGSPWVGGMVEFQLAEPFSTSSKVVPKENHRETLDALGELSIDLEVPDSGTAYYKIKTPDNKIYAVHLGSGAPTNLMTLLTIAESEIDQDTVQTLFDANNAMLVSTVESMIAADNIIPIKNVVAEYSALPADKYIRGSGTFKVFLPPATINDIGVLSYYVKSVTETITVTADGTDLIDGIATKTLTAGEGARFVCVAVGVWDAW